MSKKWTISALLLSVLAGLALGGLLASGRPAQADGQARLAADVQVAPVADTYLASGRSNEALGGRKSIWIGNDPSDYGLERTLLKFDLGQIPAGASIQQAELSLYMAGALFIDPEMSVKARLVANTWDESTAKWNQYPSDPLVPEIPAGRVTPNVGRQTLNLTALLQAWASLPNRESQVSILLIGYEGNLHQEYKFVSKDCPQNECPDQAPRLSVQFTPPTPTPTPTSTPTFTPTPTSTFTPTPTPTPTPAAKLRLSVEPLLPVDQQVEIPRGSVFTYTVSIEDVTGPLGGVILRADAEIETGGIPSVETVKSENVGGGGSVVGKQVIWNIDSLQAGQTAVYTYTLVIGPSPNSGRTLYLPGNYLLNDGAELVWTSPQLDVLRTGPLRNPPLNYQWLPLVFKR